MGLIYWTELSSVILFDTFTNKTKSCFNSITMTCLCHNKTFFRTTVILFPFWISTSEATTSTEDLSRIAIFPATPPRPELWIKFSHFLLEILLSQKMMKEFMDADKEIEFIYLCWKILLFLSFQITHITAIVQKFHSINANLQLMQTSIDFLTLKLIEDYF